MLFLVTGGAGSIGGELTRQLLKGNQNVVRIFSRNDSTHHEFLNSLDKEQRLNVRTILGDVRNKDAVRRAVDGCDCVFHCAALKHVINSGYNAYEVADVNIRGTQTVLDAAHGSERCQTVVLLSTDKVVNPTNVMGASKAVAERIILESSWTNLRRRVVRFGNVWNSRGSVFPTFVKKLLTNQRISVTNLEATRFVMTKKEAAELLMLASGLYGEYPTKVNKDDHSLLITKKLKAISLQDIIKLTYRRVKLIDPTFEHNRPIKLIGLQCGEKLHEELIADHEIQNIKATHNDAIFLTPFSLGSNAAKVDDFKRTSDVADKADLEKLLNDTSTT